MSNFTKLHLSHETFRYLPVFSQFLWNLTFIFSAPMRNFPWCYYRWLITSLGLKKNVKKNAIFFKLFWYKVFDLWELKLFSFLVESVLISVTLPLFWIHIWHSWHLRKRSILSEVGDPPETVKLRRTLAVAKFLCLSPFISLGKIG